VASASSPDAAAQDEPKQNNSSKPSPAVPYVTSQAIWLPFGWVVALGVAVAIVAVVRNREALSRQWQLQFQGEGAASVSSLGNPARTGAGLAQPFDQPVILRQPAIWSRAIVWSIAGVASFILIWACTAKIDEAIPVQGKLEPQGAVKQIQAPVGGVVAEIHVEEGERVEAGELLVSFDPTATQAKLESLEEIRRNLVQENRFYRSQMQPSGTSVNLEDNQLRISPELLSLTENRAALIAENRLYQSDLGGTTNAALSPQEQERLRTREQRRESQIADAQLEIEQLTRQLSQTQIQLANARETLTTNQEITANLESLVREGAYARLQYLRQQQETNTSQAEMSRLIQEEQRLRVAIAQAQERLQTAIASSREDTLDRMAENEKRIAEIDSQLTKVVLENESRIQEIDSQLSEARVTLKYQELKAPTSGVVFDLQPHSPGYVYNSSEPILKIVPGDDLVAQVFITNEDIGFVKEGMQVEVRIDSFPYREFGEIKGELIQIGSDALPPDQIYQYYRFPAKIRLKQQSMKLNDREVPLQSGMSLSANITVRKRTVISIFTDLFADKAESLRFTR
jgi:multidrug efflux pump subunit AcrA (membrane-fusion protein)